MPHILFISKGRDSASTRYRALNYFPYFERAGWQCEQISVTHSFFNYLAILRAASRADVVVVLRKTFSHWYVKQLRKRAKKLVFDFDDAIYLRSNGESSSKRAKGFKRIVKLSDAVWAGNQHLADKAREFNDNVKVVPTAIDINHYNVSAEKPENSIDLVWIGSSSTRKYLEMILPQLAAAYRQNTMLRLKIIADFDIENAGIPTVAVPWSIEIEAQALISSHIGIAPQIDDPWTRGKCALKVLQYMASGLPVISSNAGANKEIIVEGKTGLLVNDAVNWGSAIEMLAKNREVRDSYGMTGSQRCETLYSQNSIFRDLIETFDGFN